MTMPTALTMPETSRSSAALPRVLHREWKAIKPHLPKSASLPALQLIPRARPCFTCLGCGFVNFYNIPLCVWCATQAPESSVRAFERTIPRARTASAPPRVFWTPSELSRRAPRASESKNRISILSRDLEDPPTPTPQSTALCPRGPRRPHSMLVPPICAPSASRSGRPQAHKRSQSQPNALRIGHPNRPYYSAIRPHEDASSPANSAARCRAPRPASIALPPLALQTDDCLDHSILESDDLEDGIAFAFVSLSDEGRTPRRTLSARLSRRLASPVSALHSFSREAEMRAALATLVRDAPDPRHRGNWRAQETPPEREGPSTPAERKLMMAVDNRLPSELVHSGGVRPWPWFISSRSGSYALLAQSRAL
ncbi:hypothetical protein FB451DRAFT_1472292 [Mycena latifolia]|nr:hypothetical protein FB451DRAFT_1472292 [Mycena latifolia]